MAKHAVNRTMSLYASIVAVRALLWSRSTLSSKCDLSTSSIIICTLHCIIFFSPCCPPSYPFHPLTIPMLSFYHFHHLALPILSCPISSYPISSYPILSYPTLPHPIPSYPTLSHPIPSYTTLSPPIPSHSILPHLSLCTLGRVCSRESHLWSTQR